MAALFCTLVLTLHKTVLYAFHRGILRLHDIKPASERVFYFRVRSTAVVRSAVNRVVEGSIPLPGTNLPVAQRKEQPPSKRLVAGSNPARRAISKTSRHRGGFILHQMHN